jgi:hypothetical protein
MEQARRELALSGLDSGTLSATASARGTSTVDADDTHSSDYEEKDGSTLASRDDYRTGGYSSSAGSSVYSASGSYTEGGSSYVSGTTGAESSLRVPSTKQELINEIRRLEGLAKAHAAMSGAR